MIIGQYLWFYRFTSDLIRPNNIYLHLQYIWDHLIEDLFIFSQFVVLNSDAFYRKMNNWVIIIPVNATIALMLMLSVWNLIVGAVE